MQKQTKAKEVEYVLGHSPDEIKRLMLQGAIIKPLTERLLREAGIEKGMRVLDIGCGPGDVSLLLAELVGEDGEVVGIDRSADALSTARERARSEGHPNIEFHEASAEDYSSDEPFDFAVGRYVLIHQADPAALIRAAASQVRRGGTVAFHELAVYGEVQSLPRVELWHQVGKLILGTLGSVMQHPDAGGRMVAHFQDAGLPPPRMFCEVPIGGGPDTPLYAWVALTLRNLLPQAEKIGLATADEIQIDTLEDRLRAAASAVNSQLIGHAQFCGWARV